MYAVIQQAVDMITKESHERLVTNAYTLISPFFANSSAAAYYA